MDQSWQDILAAWQLAAAGRTAEALHYTRLGTGLHDVIALSLRDAPAPENPTVQAWHQYYRGRYHDALEGFLAASHDTPSWLTTWAQLGVAKVASDAGHWPTASQWCALAWQNAARLEHLDLLAQISGARGEILLRAGFPIDAAAAFADDLALLPPGNRYRGRLRTYSAHAWARTGPHGRTAARTSFQTALHTPGEPATRHFAAAGLTLLTLRETPANIATTLPQFDSEVRETPGLPAFWIAIAEAKTAHTPSIRASHLQRAAKLLPAVYPAEQWWLCGWSRSLGHEIDLQPTPLTIFPARIPDPSRFTSTLVSNPCAPLPLKNAPWLTSVHANKGSNPATWWQLRDHFMP